MSFEYTFRGADMADLAPKVRDLLENRDQELELFLSTIGSGGGSIPSGSMNAFAGSSAPAGWLLCDGSVVSQSTYSSLYAVIGATYNTGGEGAGNFRLPNIKGRVIVGQDASDSNFNVLGETGGAKTVALSTAQMPSHTHTGSADTTGIHSHTASTNTTGDHFHTTTDFGNNPTQTYQSGTDRFGRVATPNGLNTSTAGSHSHTVTVNNAGDHAHNVTLNSAGGGQAHNNLQPYIALNWIIKT